MSVTIKTVEMQYRGTDGQYHGINAVAEKRISDQIEAIDAALADKREEIEDVIDQIETEGNQAISDMQTAAAGIDEQAQTMMNLIAAAASAGTDPTLTTSGMAADAAATGTIVQVTTTEPTYTPGTVDKLWIYDAGGEEDTDSNEYEIPTYEEFSDLESALNKTSGIQYNEINNIEKAIINFSDINTYDMSSVVDSTPNERYCILYIDNPTFVKSIAVKTNGSFDCAIVDLEDEINDNTVLPSITNWTGKAQNATIEIESVLSKKRIVIMRYGIKYNSSKSTSSFKSAGLALYNPSTNKMTVSQFESTIQISCVLSVYEFGEKTIPVINPNIKNAIVNYAEKETYNNTGTQSSLSSTIYGLLYFDNPTFVFSFTPKGGTGNFNWCFATCEEDVADGIVLTPGEWKNQIIGSTIVINGYLSKKRVVLIDSSNIYYATTRNVDYTEQRLGICNKSTLKATTASFYSTTSWLGEFVISNFEDYNPIPFISGNENTPCDFSLFYNFGVIGDSYASGSYYPGGVGQSPRILSWVQILGRSSGAEAHNFTIPGCTTKSWYDDTGEYGRQALLAENPLELYIISLCINDAATGMTVGTLSQIEGVENPETLTDNTFYVNYAKIIHAVKTKSPKAKIICLTSDGYQYNQVDKSAYDTAIINIANYYQIPYCNQHDSPYYKLNVYKKLVNGHPTPPGYACMAKAIRELIENALADPTYSNYFYTEYLVP